MVVFDAATLTLLLWERADPPLDPATGQAISQAKERVELLVQTLHKKGTKILIPTPVLSEVLVQSGPAGLRYVEVLQKTAVFRLEPFDTRAAIELAEMTREALDAGDKKSGVEAPWQLIKLDRQIVAIARVAGASTLYTDDEKLSKFALKAKLNVTGLHELPAPASAAQTDLLAAFEAMKTEQPDEADLEASADEVDNEESAEGVGTTGGTAPSSGS
jgi:hypothetical protein